MVPTIDSSPTETHPLSQAAAPAPLPKLDFFILGAGRCGTSSLYAMLCQHPQLFLPSEKEPSFFSQGFQVVKTHREYAALYTAAQPGQLLGDASHVYLTNPGTAKLLQQRYPNARFILIFRPPAERAFSLYHFMRRHQLDPLPTFEMALKAEPERKARYIASGEAPHYIYNFLYRESGLFGRQVARYLDLFPQSQFHFLTLSQLHNRPRGSVKDIFRFLGVDESFAVQPIWINQSPHIRRKFSFLRKSSWASGLTRRPSPLHVPPMCPHTRAQLDSYFQPDGQLLYQLTGITL